MYKRLNRSDLFPILQANVIGTRIDQVGTGGERKAFKNLLPIIGRLYHKMLDPDVTHLVSNGTDRQKLIVARQRKLPILTPNCIQTGVQAGRQQDSITSDLSFLTNTELPSTEPREGRSSPGAFQREEKANRLPSTKGAITAEPGYVPSIDPDDEEAWNATYTDFFLPDQPISPKCLTEPTLCKEQEDLVNLICKGENVFYTGSAGCGKSTFLKEFVRRLRHQRKRVKIVAPTGIAALDINGSTT